MVVTRKIRVQITAFVVIALLAVSYIAIRYVGLGALVGAGGYTVHLEMPDSGGVFPNAEVTYRGVPVGRVGDMRLTATGIEVDLDIRASAPSIPADLDAVVADRSVIGEQYLDLRPVTASGPFLRPDAVIAADRTSRPPSAERLLQGVDELVSSVPITSLQTVVDQLGLAFNGTSSDLQRLLDSTSAFVTTANDNFAGTAALIDSSATVLATQQATSGDITRFSANLAAIAATLQSSDGDLRALLAAAPAAATQVTTLIDAVGPGLGVLLANLTTTAQVVSANVGGLQGLLVQLPQAVSVGSQTITAQGVDVGLAVTFFQPLPCTSGYGATVRHQGLDTTGTAPLNTAAGCTAPLSTGTGVRDSQHAVSSLGDLLGQGG